MDNAQGMAVREEQDDPIKKGEPFLVTSLYMSKPELKKSLKAQHKKRLEQIALKTEEALDQLLTLLKEKTDKRFVVMEKPKAWYDRDVVALYPMAPTDFWPDTYCESAKDRRPSPTVRSVEDDSLKFEVPTFDEVVKSFHKHVPSPLVGGQINTSFVYYFGGNNYHNILCLKGNNGGFYHDRDSEFVDFSNSWNLCCIPIHRLNGTNSSPFSYEDSVLLWLSKGFVPEGLPKPAKELYLKVSKEYSAVGKYMRSQEGKVTFDKQAFIWDVEQGKIKELLGVSFDFEQELQAIEDGTAQNLDVEEFQQMLLECDYRRANLSCYDNKRLSDMQLGHWDLCEVPEEQEDYIKVNLSEQAAMVARPPRKDVKDSYTCGIDFGTKSTVVALYDGQCHMLRIGCSDVLKQPEKKDYENPTVIEFRDLSGFLEAYNARDGRPFTKWEQVTVSHTADSAIYGADVDSSIYSSLLSELKQYVNDPKRNLVVRDGQGHTAEIKPFLKLKDGDLDPIEIYAYYLGLYINNMSTEGICLHYVMSFPVKFSREVKQKLLESFAKGLRKALPIALLQDEEVMENFEVYEGAPEPAAYAISALEQAGKQPEKSEDIVYYAVFDFGGGTTDFDFGYEKKMEAKGNRRAKYKYELHRLGEGSDHYLGGENLKLLLAYEVYKANVEKMRTNRAKLSDTDDAETVPAPITIVLPPKGVRFPGSERLVYDIDKASHAAMLNSKILAKALRGIWEEDANYGEGEPKVEGGKLSINLYSDNRVNNNDRYKLDLEVDEQALKATLKKVIEEGVKSFFIACRRTFDDYKNIGGDIHIFLAGNSSKSSIVKELFRSYMEKELLEEETKLVLHGCETTQPIAEPEEVAEAESTEAEAAETDKEDGRKPQEIVDYSTLRTGKTGVVFGLLRSRTGGRDVKVATNIEAVFSFYLGAPDEHDCFANIISKDVPYDKWEEFDYAIERSFELYYTSSSAAITGVLPINSPDVKMVRCHIKADECADDDETMIFIRKVAPGKIEYAVGTASEFNDFDAKNFNKEIYKLELV